MSADKHIKPAPADTVAHILEALENALRIELTSHPEGSFQTLDPYVAVRLYTLIIRENLLKIGVKPEIMPKIDADIDRIFADMAQADRNNKDV